MEQCFDSVVRKIAEHDWRTPSASDLLEVSEGAISLLSRSGRKRDENDADDIERNSRRINGLKRLRLADLDYESAPTQIHTQTPGDRPIVTVDHQEHARRLSR